MSDTSTPPNGTVSAQRVDYQALKAWISAQEAYEAQTNHPAPLTPAQRQAIAELTRGNPNHVTQKNDVDDKDYISILQHFLSATQSAGTTVTYSDAVQVPSPFPSPLWTQSLTLTLPPSAPLTFPLPHPKTSSPAFARKKDAKKYAAKLCVSHLLSTGHLVPDPSSPDLPLVPSSSPLSPRRRGVAAPSGTIGPRDDGIPATQRVEELCRRLGLQAPAYQLRAAGGAAGSSSGTWDGEAHFGRDAFQVPPGVGRVAGVFGKKHAKEAMAEKCLEYLLGVEERREGERRMVLGDD